MYRASEENTYINILLNVIRRYKNVFLGKKGKSRVMCYFWILRCVVEKGDVKQ